jgi:hypothetical protein
LDDEEEEDERGVVVRRRESFRFAIRGQREGDYARATESTRYTQRCDTVVLSAQRS